MKTTMILALAAALLIGFTFIGGSNAVAQTCPGNGSNFVDKDGDGFNDNAPDADGDGIPNGLDTDYVKQAKDGDGYKHGVAARKSTGNGNKTFARKFNQARRASGTQAVSGGAFGTGQRGFGNGACDGTGLRGNGTGVCDGTGPKGHRGGR